jgi:hypothetical protein
VPLIDRVHGGRLRDDRILSEAWNGQSWSVEPISAPDDSPLAERWNGSNWSIQHMPNLATSPNIELTGISCTSATACVSVGYVPGGSCYAVGNYLNISAGSDWPTAEAWNGTS